ncbi:nitroreductase family protein [Candidatus Bathyarchaeota archaeon]|nr:nitroreductase family protein [Candidatus Bathyarchaeota archaeon]
MSSTDFVLDRRSIRRYKKKEIPPEVLNKILEAGRQAPSAANQQPFRFVIVSDAKLKQELSGLFSRFIKDAPLVIVGCADVKAVLTGKWAPIDTAIAMQNMVIAAWTLGVGSCWIGSFKEDKVKQLLNIPPSWKVVGFISLGYPSEQPKPRKKKPQKKLFSYNKF